MRKISTLLICSMMSMFISTSAQTLLVEDFEEATTMPPTGWSVINDTQAGTQFHWELNTSNPVAGKKSASVSCGSFLYDEPKKEEWLITPELILDANSYKLHFLWYGATKASIVDKEYDMQVRVQVDGETTWTTIFSILDQESVVNSGLTWPWAAWTKNESNVDLTAYKGRKIKVAFVHCKLVAGKGKGNDIRIDDIKVEKYTPVLTPNIEASLSSYTFPAIYIGSKKYSDVITIKNVGTGTLELESVSGLEGTDFATTIDPSKVQLKKGESYQFYATYAPTKLGAAKATLKLKAVGGNTVDIVLNGTKKALPSGYNYEGFESNTFAPIGWKIAGSGWIGTNYAISGDKSASSSICSESALISPRLDLTEDKEHTVSFDWYNIYEATTDDAVGPESYFLLYLSTDGGTTWNQIAFDDAIYNEPQHSDLALGNPKSDNCYLKWVYNIPDFDLTSFDQIPEYSTVFLDDVVLPKYYGADGVPLAATILSPADKVTNQTNKNLTLSWNGSLFAQGYKVYVGTSTTSFEIVNGVDAGQATSYECPRLDYNKTYYWKIVPYNAVGENTNATTWSFTTMEDQSVSSYPYFQGFEVKEFPLGWVTTKESNTRWAISNFNAFDGTGSAYVAGNTSNTSAILSTPEFVLPADNEAVISFYWGNKAPGGLKKDPTGIVPNPTTTPNDIDACYFEIDDNGTWKTLAIISEYSDENLFWHRENISLADYKGKTISLRWRYQILNGIKSSGASLDNIKIDLTSGNCLAYFNVSDWKAGEVNYNKSVNAKSVLSLSNGGTSALTIKDATFATSNFSTTLTKGQVLAAGKTELFNITYSAGSVAGNVNDALKLEFTDGSVLNLPVSGTTLPEDIFYSSFEDDIFGSVQPNDFTTLDIDGCATVKPVLINYPKIGNPFAYLVINVTPECADWRNVYPRSGNQVLLATCDGGRATNTNDWIISKHLEATANSNFRFYAKSYGSSTDFDLHKVSVLVSTTDMQPSSFEEVQSNIELPYSSTQAFTEFNVKLDKYAGKKVYVALKHVSTPDGFVAFFDDFYFEHFKDAGAGVESSLSDVLSIYPNPVTNVLYLKGVSEADVVITSMAGSQVKSAKGVQSVDVSDLAPGIYIVTVKAGAEIKTLKIVKK